LDYSATTPLHPKVLEAMIEFAQTSVGNASSIHSFGRSVASRIDEARATLGAFLHCNFTDIIFTSGATEANNIALAGLITKYISRYPHQKPHVITTTIEHSSVLEVIKSFADRDLIEVTYITPHEDGVVDAQSIKQALRDTTLLVSVMYVNNEIGTIQPIREIGKIVEKHNNAKERAVEIAKMNGERVELLPLQKTYMHTDATQAPLYCNCDVLHLHVDMLSLSAHKVYGPTGVGALYVKAGTPLANILHGGDQELALRPGTHNSLGVVGMGEAFKRLTPEWVSEYASRLLPIRDYALSELQKIGGVINGSLTSRTPHNIHVTFPGCEGQMLLYQLDAKGYCVSTGSACSSGASLPSHVVLALGKDVADAQASLRITLGENTTKEMIEGFIEALKPLVKCDTIDTL
ncbi:cysteine desulfurase, partial [Candidatus Falkowbacteria bacterium]|nr:cysteine desulfurase [Candidatus Falkowbacteria bacterium]